MWLAVLCLLAVPGSQDGAAPAATASATLEGHSVELVYEFADARELGDPIRMELVHDGAQTRFVHDQTQEPKLPPTASRAGELFLLSKTNRVVSVDSIRVRGRLNAASRARLREAWIARAVQETER